MNQDYKELIEDSGLTWSFLWTFALVIIAGAFTAMIFGLDTGYTVTAACGLYTIFLLVKGTTLGHEAKSFDFEVLQLEVEQRQSEANALRSQIEKLQSEAVQLQSLAKETQLQANALRSQSEHSSLEIERLRGVERSLTKEKQLLLAEIANATQDVANAQKEKANALAIAEKQKANALREQAQAHAPLLEYAKHALNYRHSRANSVDKAVWGEIGENAKMAMEAFYTENKPSEPLT